jgi:hypothetical protein
MPNVVPFPKIEQPTSEQDHINETLEPLLTLIIKRLVRDGFVLDVESEAHIKSMTLVTQSLRARMCRSIGLDHPLHKLSDDLFTVSIKDKTIDWAG